MVDQAVSTRLSNETVLSQDVLERCHQRAPGYDRDNSFFHEDFEELRAAGYLTIGVPRELGGRGSAWLTCVANSAVWRTTPRPPR